MNDKYDKTKFGATVAVSKDEMKQARFNILSAKQDRQAEKLGLLIAEEKGWYSYPHEDMFISEMRLYVFTPSELRDYMHDKFKDRLLSMAANEKYLSPEQKRALELQAERF